MPLLLGFFAVQPGAVEQSVTRLVIQDEIILRVPVQPRPLVRHIEWKERKGPKCVPVQSIRRAMNPLANATLGPVSRRDILTTFVRDHPWVVE